MNQQQMPAIEIPPEADEESAILQFMTGTVEDQEFWAYVAMRPTMYQEYVARVHAGDELDITEYGEVLEQGWGQEPPQEIKDKMIEEYGAEDDFEVQMQKIIEEALAKNKE